MIEIRTREDIATLSETVELECKLAAGKHGKGELPADFWPTYSAFANTHGGIVLLGVKEKQGHFSLHGVQEPQHVVTVLFNHLNNRQKVSVNLLTDSDVKVLVIGGCNLIQITIPPAHRKQKPVYLGSTPFNGQTYRRLHEGDRSCDDESVRRMLAEQVEDERDNRILPGFGMADIDLDSLFAYRQLLRAEKPGHVWLEEDDAGLLRCLKGWRHDRQSGEEGLTLAGVLMFGKWDAIQDAAPHYFVDYQERPEAKTEARWIDRLVPDGTWSGNLFDFYRRVYRKLTTDMKVPFVLKDGMRKEDTPVHEAIREALVNTLVHADYTGRVSVLVVKRPDMFGFRNPGNMRIPVEQAVKGGESDCRNRIIHQMFLMIGLGERAGSGVPKIYSGWKCGHWRPPALYQKDEPEQTVLELRMIDLLPSEVLDQLKMKFANKFDSLSQLDRLVLATAVIEGVVSHPRLLEISIDHPHDLTMALQKLVRADFLITSGHGRGAVYYIKGAKLANPDEVFTGGAALGTLEGSDHSSESLQDNSEGLVVEDLDMPLIHDLTNLKPSLRNELEAIALVARNNKRLSNQEMTKTIRELCCGRYLTLKVLGGLLNRSEDYLRQRVLNPLVEKRFLQRAFPAAPNDPRQAYTANKPNENS